MSSLQRNSSFNGVIDFEEDIIWAIKQRKRSMKKIRSDIYLPRLHPDSSSLMRFQKETLSETMATMVPNEVITNIDNYEPEVFFGCLLSGKILGITELMEFQERNGISANEMIKTLNRYIAAIIEEAMSFEGDILNLSADSFLVLFKSANLKLLKYYVHAGINCALVIQKKYGKFVAAEGIILKVKLALTAGSIFFSLLCHPETCSYACFGTPVDEIAVTEENSESGDIMVASSAWTFVNVSEYSFLESEDKKYHKILGVGANWKCAGREHLRKKASTMETPEFIAFTELSEDYFRKESEQIFLHRQEDFALRPILLEVKHLQGDVAKFLISPVLATLRAQEPLESLIETRQMVIMHVSIKMGTIDEGNAELLNQYYKIICNRTSEHKGLVTNCMISCGNITFNVIFGLRGFTSVIESQEALRCAVRCRHEIDLFDEVETVSVSCTTGKVYCGVLGHSLRKEYLMISKCMFKAFRMVRCFPDKVTCDRTTFIYSNLESENFTLMDVEKLHEFGDAGPIYEYEEKGVPSFSDVDSQAYPILGREEEIESFLKLFRIYQENFGTKPCCSLPQCSFKNCIIIEGTNKQGKSKFFQELATRVEDVDVQRISFNENDVMSNYNAVRLIMTPKLGLREIFSPENIRRKRIMKVMGNAISEELMYVLNDVFDVNFQMDGTNRPEGEVKMQLTKECVKMLCEKCFEKPTLIMMEHAEYMDQESSVLLLSLLETKRFFLIIAVDETRSDPTHLNIVLGSHHTERISLRKIAKRYLAGLTCQFLKVYAIPADLEKMIQLNSKGNPGWIQNFLLILLQTKKITVTEVDFKSIHELALVAPPLYMLKKMSPKSIEYYKTLLEEKTEDHTHKTDPWSMYIDSCRDTFKNVDVRSDMQKMFCKQTRVPVCLLTEPLDPQIDVDPDMTDDLQFLERYDRLSYEEQLVLRCASVLGDPFTRRLLFFIWMPNSEREAAEVLQKLFDKEALCCAGGDFSSGGDYILIREHQRDPCTNRRVGCHCIGLDIHDSCLFMAKYASCGFMRFRSEEFCRTVYGQIPEEDRKELHSRAAKFIQKETRRCVSCGCGYFPVRSGCKMDNSPMGRANLEVDKRKKAPQLEQMDFDALFDYSTHATGRLTMMNVFDKSTPRSTLSSNVRSSRSFLTDASMSDDRSIDLTYEPRHAVSSKYINPITLYNLRRHASLVRTFSKSDFLSCECHLILNHMYKQLKRHYTGSGLWYEMVVSSIYYIKICMSNQNYAACMITIKEVLDILENNPDYLNNPKWMIKMLIAKFQGLKGNVLLAMNDVEEAHTMLLKAMKTFGLPFPKNEKSLRFNLKLYHQKWKNNFRLYFSPSSYLNEHVDVTQLYISNSIAETLTNLCEIYMAKGEWKLAELAAQLSLKNSLQTETSLIRICQAFSSMLVIAQHYNRRILWISLEVHALRYCHKKRNFVEAPELKAVSCLYLTIFEARMSRAEYDAALQLGYITVRISTRCNNLFTTIELFVLISTILIGKMTINDATTILRELEYFADEIDNNSGRTWYYSQAVLFHLETGYILCPFSSVENYFYGEIFTENDKYYEANMRLVITMWVWYLRTNRWESASMFKKELDTYKNCNIDSNNHAISHLYLLEGALLTLVNKINKRSITGMIEGKKEVQRLLKKLHKAETSRTFIATRLYLLEAYYWYILENGDKRKKCLNKARKCCLKFEDNLVLLHLEHLEKAWNNELTLTARDFWKNHCNSETYISYHEMDMNNLKIYSYTYPKPQFRI